MKEISPLKPEAECKGYLILHLDQETALFSTADSDMRAQNTREKQHRYKVLLVIFQQLACFFATKSLHPHAVF